MRVLIFFLDNCEQNFALQSAVFLRINAVHLTKYSLTPTYQNFSLQSSGASQVSLV